MRKLFITLSVVIAIVVTLTVIVPSFTQVSATSRDKDSHSVTEIQSNHCLSICQSPLLKSKEGLDVTEEEEDEDKNEKFYPRFVQFSKIDIALYFKDFILSKLVRVPDKLPLYRLYSVVRL